MFKLAKYYMLVNLYKRAKKNILRVFMSIVLMVLVSYLFADITTVVSKENSYGFLALKWLILLVSMFIIIVNIRQIVKIASSPFGEEVNKTVSNVKKERILAKEHLISRTERIIEKYRSAK